MLEIFALYELCRYIGDKLRDKRLNPRPYQVVAVLAWFGGQGLGFVILILVFGPLGEETIEEQTALAIGLYYGLTLLLGALCAGIVVLVVHRAKPPPLPPPPEGIPDTEFMRRFGQPH